MTEALQIAVDLCKRFEGLRLKPYLCPANVATIGIGSTTYEDGRAVSLADAPITVERAEALLMHELERRCVPGVLRACPRLVGEPRRLGAVLDWTYNCGVGAFQTSTFRRALSSGDWAWAAKECRRWTRAAGRELPGLVARRAAEAVLING